MLISSKCEKLKKPAREAADERKKALLDEECAVMKQKSRKDAAKRLAVLVAVSLIGCQQRNTADDRRLTALEDRVSELEMANAKTSAAPSPSPAPAASASVATRRPHYELVILGIDGPTRTYTSEARCQAAKQAIMDEQAAQCPQGAICNPYKATCVPVE